MMFTFELEGVEQTLDDIEKLFSVESLQKIQDAALEEGAEFLKEKIYDAQYRTRDTGQTAKELTFSKPRTIDGERVITIHWSGDGDRYRIIHLQENGFFDKSGKFVRPSSYGQIESVMTQHRSQYLRIVQDSIARQIGAM